MARNNDFIQDKQNVCNAIMGMDLKQFYDFTIAVAPLFTEHYFNCEKCFAENQKICNTTDDAEEHLELCFNCFKNHYSEQ